MHRQMTKKFMLILLGMAFAACSVGAAIPPAPESGIPEIGDSRTDATAVDGNHVYWIQATVVGGTWATGLKYRSDVVDRNFLTGEQRVAFSTTGSRIDGLAAGGGRLAFSVVSMWRNRKLGIGTRRETMYVLNHGGSPQVLATFGGTAKMRRNQTWLVLECLSQGYLIDASEDGTITLSERENTCGTTKRNVPDRLIGYRAGGTRVELSPDDEAVYWRLHRNKLYSYAEDFSARDTTTGVTLMSPIKDWIGSVDFEGDRAVANRSDVDYDYRSSFIFFNPETLAPIHRVTAKRGQLLAPRLCANGYAVVSGKVRTRETSETDEIILGDAPHVAKFYSDTHQELRSVRLPNRDIISLDCDGDNLVVTMVGRKGPMVTVVPR